MRLSSTGSLTPLLPSPPVTPPTTPTPPVPFRAPAVSTTPALDLYESCKSWALPWSPIANAIPNASLAAVLAGFMITATAFLLNRPNSNSAGRSHFNPHAVALFSSGVLVLGLDAYLFSTIAAESPVTSKENGLIFEDARQACSVAWTQGMVASAMLAAGGTAMGAGLGALLRQHLIPDQSDAIKARPAPSGAKLVHGLPTFLVFVIITSTSLLMFRFVVRYVHAMNSYFPVKLALSDQQWIWIEGAFLALVTAILTARSVGIARGVSWIRQQFTGRREQSAQPRVLFLAIAAFLMTSFALTGSVFAGLVSGMRADSASPVSETWMYSSIMVSLLFLMAIQVAIAFSVFEAQILNDTEMRQPEHVTV